MHINAYQYKYTKFKTNYSTISKRHTIHDDQILFINPDFSSDMCKL